MNLTDISFDQDDKNLFQIDDLRLKADAIRFSILPKLHGLVNHAISKVRDVYGVEALEDSHVKQSPNFRLKRKGELTYNYEWALVGLTGKRGKGGSREWTGIKRPDGGVQIAHFDYDFRLTENGLQLDFSCLADWVSVQSQKKFVKFLKLFEEEIHTLCYRSKILPDLGWNDEYKPFSRFEDNSNLMLDADVYSHYSFLHPYIKFPITKLDLENLVESFVYFYPVYDSYIRIAKGKHHRLTC
jgi:hypothetical protein